MPHIAQNTRKRRSKVPFHPNHTLFHDPHCHNLDVMDPREANWNELVGELSVNKATRNVEPKKEEEKKGKGEKTQSKVTEATWPQ